jgi:hypothetical protein
MKWASVASDMMGASGRAMLVALIAGRADPQTMAALAKRRMRRKIPHSNGLSGSPRGLGCRDQLAP